jgi:hypothetical protein
MSVMTITHADRGSSFVAPSGAIATSAMGYYALNIFWPQMISAYFTQKVLTESYYQMASSSAILLAGFAFIP